MVTKKKGQDVIDSLPRITRKHLEAAPDHGRYLVPYTVGRVFVARGWGDHLGKSTMQPGLIMPANEIAPRRVRSGPGVPTSLVQLNADGLAAARTARQRSRAALDGIAYAAVHETTTSEIPAMLEDYSLDSLIRSAQETLTRVEAAELPTGGARGYLDALIEYQKAQEDVPA